MNGYKLIKTHSAHQPSTFRPFNTLRKGHSSHTMTWGAALSVSERKIAWSLYSLILFSEFPWKPWSCAENRASQSFNSIAFSCRSSSWWGHVRRKLEKKNKACLWKAKTGAYTSSFPGTLVLFIPAKPSPIRTLRFRKMCFLSVAIISLQEEEPQDGNLMETLKLPVKMAFSPACAVPPAPFLELFKTDLSVTCVQKTQKKRKKMSIEKHDQEAFLIYFIVIPNARSGMASNLEVASKRFVF